MNNNFASSEIPLISKSYNDDKKIINFCKNNKNDYKCKCVFPEDSINKLQINSFNPYYCWYQPCRDSSTYKTSLIQEYKKSCNVVICQVNIGDVELDDNGFIKINNSCISSSSLNTNNISQELIDTSLNNDYILPSLFLSSFYPLILGMVNILFLIH